MPHHDLLEFTQSRLDAMLTVLHDLVAYESPSREKLPLDGLAARLAARFAALGGDAERLTNPDGGDHVRARFAFGTDRQARPALVLGHFDTVYPLGTVAKRPFRIEAGRASGPGTYDMKAGLVLIEFALAALLAREPAPPRPVVVLLTSDEEIGSPTSRGLIEAEARAAEYALVVEPPLPGGRLKTARKGVGGFTLEVFGKAAHAGVEPEKGASAIVELAHQVLTLAALADPAAGTTINVGVVHGGTTPNVVPEHAAARIDVRVATLAEAARVEAAIRGLRPVTRGTSLRIDGGMNRPPMERTPAVATLFERARTIARSLGLELGEGATGGASDGNFTAALGLPTLDGLGAEGDGAHAEYEHILIYSLPERAALLAALLLGL